MFAEGRIPSPGYCNDIFGWHTHSENPEPMSSVFTNLQDSILGISCPIHRDSKTSAIPAYLNAPEQSFCWCRKAEQKSWAVASFPPTMPELVCNTWDNINKLSAVKVAFHWWEFNNKQRLYSQTQLALGSGQLEGRRKEERGQLKFWSPAHGKRDTWI